MLGLSGTGSDVRDPGGARGDGARAASVRAALLMRVREAKRRRHWANAEAALREALAADPGDPFWRSSFADLLWRRGDAEEALAVADGVLTEHPGFVPALVARGLAASRLRRHADALAALEAAWAAAPSAFVGRHLAQVRAHTEGPAQALEFLRQALERFPGDAGLLKQRAMLLERRGEAAEAAASYRSALEAAPDDDFAYAHLLGAQLAGRPPDEAVAELDRVLRLPSRAGSAQLQALRATLLERAGRYSEAVQAWEAAAAADPGNGYLRARLAFACRRAGQRERAFGLLQDVIEAGRSDPAALGAYVADARALGRRAQAQAFLVELVRRHPQRGSLWGWIRRLGRDGDSAAAEGAGGDNPQAATRPGAGASPAPAPELAAAAGRAGRQGAAGRAAAAGRAGAAGGGRAPREVAARVAQGAEAERGPGASRRRGAQPPGGADVGSASAAAVQARDPVRHPAPAPAAESAQGDGPPTAVPGGASGRRPTRRQRAE